MIAHLYISIFCHGGHVTWLNSRPSLPASALCAVNSRPTSQKIWGGFLYRVYSLGEWLWIDSSGKMETRHPVEGSFCNEFPSIYSHCRVMAAWSRKTLKKSIFFACFGKTTPYWKIFKIQFRKDSSQHQSTCCVQISWNFANRNR